MQPSILMSFLRLLARNPGLANDLALPKADDKVTYIHFFFFIIKKKKTPSNRDRLLHNS
jgi:hypothetical protein